MVLTTNNGLCGKLADMKRNVVNKLNAPLRLFRQYYSYVLGRDVDMRQTRLLTEVQAAFFLFIMPADYSLVLRAASCLWFIVALRKCRNMFD